MVVIGIEASASDLYQWTAPGDYFLIIRHCSFSGLWCRGRSSRDAPDKLKSEFTLSMGVRCRFQGGTSIAFCPAETSPKTQRFVS
jgi:hypothetical protein